MEITVRELIYGIALLAVGAAVARALWDLGRKRLAARRSCRP